MLPALALLLPRGASAWHHDVTPENAALSCGEVSGPSGVYDVGGTHAMCDTTADGGGWTLVASGQQPPGDYGGHWYPDLTTLQPKTRDDGHYLWYQDHLSASMSDMRFSCATSQCDSSTNCSFAADLVFYHTPWYPWIAGATHRVRRCFAAQRVHPKRCDLLTNTCIEEWVADEATQEWGEELCNEWGDDGRSFHIDFKWGATSTTPLPATGAPDWQDLTSDWGVVNGVWRCGHKQCRGGNSTLLDPINANTTADNCAWFAWVRGPRIVAEVFDPLAPVPEGDVGILTDSIFYLLGCFVAVLIPVSTRPTQPHRAHRAALHQPRVHNYRQQEREGGGARGGGLAVAVVASPAVLSPAFRPRCRGSAHTHLRLSHRSFAHP